MSTKKTLNKNQKKGSSPPISIKLFFLLSFLALIIITTSIYFKSLNNNFTNWDDDLYITQNPDIGILNGGNINSSLKKTFTSYVNGNYHPITMLTYSLEYAKYKLNPKPYHVTNLIIHLLNVLLVFYFIWLLTKQKWTAFITSLLFAIHPMHVESVVWVSERKDLLYTFFYLSSLCSYIFFLQKEKKKWVFYALTFLLFILAILSKAMAVSLPIIFFAIDYFLGKKFTGKTVLEKLPFIVLSIIFGYIAIEAQMSINAMEDVVNYNFFDRILFSSYAILMYLWKLFIPTNISCFYDYPIQQGGMYPGIFYIAPLMIIALSLMIYKSVRNGKDILFGFGFFIISIALVLQILPVGGAIIADRYTYIPYIGIFFIIARFINNLIENKIINLQLYKIPLIIICTTITLMYAYLTFQRTKVWEDTITLFTDAMKNNNRASISFMVRGNAYYYKGQYENAISDLNKAILLKNDYAEAYLSRGSAYFNLGKINEAIKNFSLAIIYKPNYGDAYCDRAIAYLTNKKYNLALQDALKAKGLGFQIHPHLIDDIETRMNNKKK